MPHPFIEKHPIPWSIARDHYEGWYNEEVQDANGHPVVSTADASGYQSWFEGDMDSFIDFINSLEENN